MYPVTLGDLLMNVIESEASDLHIVVGCPPIVRRFGELQSLNDRTIGADDARDLIASIMSPEQLQALNRNRQIDFACSILGVARFRVHVSFERDNLTAEFRAIPYIPPQLEELNLPPVVADVTQLNRGLVLVTGPTGAGKSTTLAAMVDHINRTRNVRVVTIEEPIEFLHGSQKAIITQREIGRDTLTYSDAIRATLRQDPDVILIGEMRDLESISLALAAAETGHLVLATLHTLSAPDSVNRIVDVFPHEQQDQVRIQLASVIEAVFSQLLVMRSDGLGRVCVAEVLLGTSGVRTHIRDNEVTEILGLMQGGFAQGMQTFEMHFARLVQEGLVSAETALAKALRPDDMQRLLGISPLEARRTAAGG
jgi:twitching motility protein PilT